jgi:hypothetical protein
MAEKCKHEDKYVEAVADFGKCGVVVVIRCCDCDQRFAEFATDIESD